MRIIYLIFEGYSKMIYFLNCRVCRLQLYARNVVDLDCCHVLFAMEARNLYTETTLQNDLLL